VEAPTFLFSELVPSVTVNVRVGLLSLFTVIPRLLNVIVPPAATASPVFSPRTVEPLRSLTLVIGLDFLVIEILALLRV
jgi:hypothetical protein